MKKKEVTLAQYRALSEFRYRIRAFLHSSDSAARAAGLEPQQHQLLLAVKGFAGEGELIDRIEERGLVDRRTGQNDRRQDLPTCSRVTARFLCWWLT